MPERRATTQRYDVVKRAVDVVVSGVLLVLSAPAQVVVGLLVRLRLGSPVLFRQPRPGLHEDVFELVKFRTMLAPDPEQGLVTDDERLTRLGRVLRATSLDELPSLWNVLVGDMSLVGPRPLLVRYVERYSPRQRGRHAVRPGITGLAQVNGRNALSWEEKFELDLEYVERRSLRLDLHILAMTALKVVRRDGITDGKTSTMAEFEGTARVVDLDLQV